MIRLCYDELEINVGNVPFLLDLEFIRVDESGFTIFIALEPNNRSSLVINSQ